MKKHNDYTIILLNNAYYMRIDINH